MWLPKNDESHPFEGCVKVIGMNEDEGFLMKIREEFVKFESTMEELHFLKCVAQDLRSFRRMIKLKRYD